MHRVRFPTLRTGGPLNRINEQYRLNKRADTVSIMQLVDAHKPSTEAEVVQLLESHQHACKICPCRVRNGGLDNWAKRLHSAAQHEKFDCSLTDCRNFMYDLFVRGPLRGRITEQAALRMLTGDFRPSSILRSLTQTRTPDLRSILWLAAMPAPWPVSRSSPSPINGRLSMCATPMLTKIGGSDIRCTTCTTIRPAIGKTIRC